jgi:hypothetical protein
MPRLRAALTPPGRSWRINTNAVAKAPQQSTRVVSRAVVDNDDLKRDVSLREHAAQRQFEQLTAVVGGNDD